MSDLIDVADMAYPLADYRVLLGKASVVAGYLGGDTPHTWTGPEIAAVRNAGLVWWGIWTAPSRGQKPTAGMGADDGTRTVTALRSVAYSAALPVFYDIERDTYMADPGGAGAAWRAWQGKLAAAGYRHTWPYLPASAGYGWAANWTGTRPESVPRGTVGVQYAGNAGGGTYDLSVFSRSALGLGATSKGDTVADLTAADKAWIKAEIDAGIHALSLQASAYVWDNAPANKEPCAHVHIKADTAAILAKLATVTPGSVDTAALAAAVSKTLGATLAADVADVLARRLTA